MILLGVFMLVVLFGCSPGNDAPSPESAEGDASYQASVLEYRRARDVDLRDPEGWLSLAGLYWLRQGRNTFGSDPQNDVVLPDAKGPLTAGSFYVEDGRVRVEVTPGVPVTHGGEPVTSLALKDDANGEPTTLTLGSLQILIIERVGRLGVRIKDSENEALTNFRGIEYYPIEPNWRLEARYEPYPSPREVNIPNVMGSFFREPSPGRLTLQIAGETYHLHAVPDGPSHVLVFADLTNGSETYGGGRYLRLDLPAEAGRVIVDFNKAYNPPCVFTPYATCPLPPPEHKLSAAIRAGEKAYKAVSD